MPPGPGVFPGRRDAAVWCIQVNKASCALCHRRRSVASKFKASCWCERLLAPKHNLACWGRPAFILRVGMDISQLECTHPRVWALLSAAEEQDFTSVVVILSTAYTTKFGGPGTYLALRSAVF